MFGRKKRKVRSKKVKLTLAGSRSKKDKKVKNTGSSIKAASTAVLVVFAAFCLLGTCGIAFGLLERYVNKVVPVSQRTGVLQLKAVPAWVSRQLQGRIYAAAVSSKEDLKLDADVAQTVYKNLTERTAWLDKIKIRTLHDRILVEARWRKPVAFIKAGLKRLYVDSELVVLDYVPLPKLAIVRVTGLSIEPPLPSPGQIWRQDDLAAAVEILTKLQKMDEIVTPEKPLLAEIDRIDMSNFKGRQNSHAAHIILYTKDNTEIIWGAEYGQWQRYLESTDKQKIAKLYQHYKEYGTLLGAAKYINLCDPRDDIPLPIDRY